MKLNFLLKRLISRSSQKGATERVRERDLLCCLFCSIRQQHKTLAGQLKKIIIQARLKEN
jgi:hypothetical protein